MYELRCLIYYILFHTISDSLEKKKISLRNDCNKTFYKIK